MAANQRCIAQRSVSASTRSPSSVEPTTSAKTMVTTLRRSPGAGESVSAAPHAGQNRAPSMTPSPQRGHLFTTPSYAWYVRANRQAIGERMATRFSASRVDDFQAALDDAAAAALRERGQAVSYARGRTVFHEGQVPDRVLLLRTGVVKVRLVTGSGREVVLAFRGPGELVGEQSAVDGSPRSATIVAVEPVEALAFTHSAFRRFLLDHPDAALALLAILSRRLREADARRAEFSSLSALG